MAGYTVSSVTNALNKLSGDRLIEAVAKESPLIGIARKRTDFKGKSKSHVVMYGVGGGQSATFSTAQTNKSAAAIAEYTITRIKDYALASVDNELILASQDKGAVANMLKVAVDNATLSCARSAGIHIYRGGGYRAVVGSTGSGNFVCATLSDAANFTVGMVIECNTAADGSGTARSGYGTVTGVNVTTGTVTYSGTITSITANDYVARNGDFGAVTQGLGTWIPSSTPSTLFGFDRSVAPEYLGGSRITYQGSVEDTIIDLAAAIAKLGGRADIGVMNPMDWATLVKEIGSKDLQRSVVKSSLSGERMGNVGYDAIGVFAGSGRIELIADYNCPKGRMWLGKRDTLEIWSLGQMVGPLLNGSQTVDYNADSLEVRVGGYYQTVVTEAWHWGTAALT